MRTVRAAVFAIAILTPLFAEGPAEQFAQITGTQAISFAPGGTVHWNKSYGDLYIEGWDQPRVEINVTRSTIFYDPGVVQKNSARLETVGVTANRRSDTDIEISTTSPKRADWSPPLPSHHHNKVRMEYRVRVPRDSHLVIDHRGGMVLADNITGDIDIANRDGDIMLMLPEKGSYDIDARSNMGHIASDFDGKTLSRYLVGQRFIGSGPSPSHNIRLRTGFGGITIQALSSEGQALSTAEGEIEGAQK